MAGQRQGLEIEQRLTQRLTQQQLRFVKLLELSAPELDDEVAREMESNPALEAEDATDSTPVQDTSSSSPWNPFPNRNYDSETETPISDNAPTLYESLLSQLGQLHLDPDVRTAAEYIIGNLDSNGRLQRSLPLLANDMAFSQGIDLPLSVMEEGLAAVQSLEPHGVGGRDLAETLLLQLRYLPESEARADAIRILSEQFEAFSMLHTHFLMSRLRLSADRVERAIDLIRTLNPKPGASVDSWSDSTNTIIPDVIIDTSGAEPTITLNNRIPELRISETFSQAERSMQLRAKKKKEKDPDQEFILNRYHDAREFIRTLRMRQETLLTVVTAIVKLQKEYFETEDVYRLRPMMIKDIAAETGLDFSVISRSTANKYAALPWGIFPLRFFFSDTVGDNSGESDTDALTNRKIEAEIQRVVEAEDKRHPLSDEKITQTLIKDGLNISRRTVAKYRDRLQIPPARLRKSLGVKG